jgi:hypothetical protein
VLRSWLKEERRLGRASWLNPAVLLALGLAFTTLGVAAALQRSRALQDEHDARLREALGILTATMAGVQRNAQDWAHWTSMYQWVQGGNPSFLKTDVETTPLFDEGGLFLIFNPDGSKKLSFGHQGHDHPSTLPLYACARQHLQRLPTPGFRCCAGPVMAGYTSARPRRSPTAPRPRRPSARW